MTATERATFAQIANLARSLQRMRKPRERVAISRRLLALAVSLGDAEEKRPAPAKPVSLHPMSEEEALTRLLRVPPPPKGVTVAKPSRAGRSRDKENETGN